MEREIQYIKNETGEVELAVVPIETLEALRAAAEAAQDNADAEAAYAEMEAGNYVPGQVVRRISDGENRIRVWREWRKLTATELAGKAGLTQAYISQIETGKRDPSLSALRMIAAALSVEPGDLI